jgi:hypothetical protein
LYFQSASSLKEQSADRHVGSLGHIILIPSHPVFALSPYIINTACLAEKQQVLILYSLVANHYITDVVANHYITDVVANHYITDVVANHYITDVVANHYITDVVAKI